ncbi:hypothetical protein V5O48_016683, partial [Marasmius crinis-equi]
YPDPPPRPLVSILQISNNKAKVAALSEALRFHEEIYERRQQRFEELESENGSLFREMQNIKRIFAVRETNVSDLQQEKSELQQQISLLGQENKCLQGEADCQRNGLQEEINRLRQTIVALEADCWSLARSVKEEAFGNLSRLAPRLEEGISRVSVDVQAYLGMLMQAPDFQTAQHIRGNVVACISAFQVMLNRAREASVQATGGPFSVARLQFFDRFYPQDVTRVENLFEDTRDYGATPNLLGVLPEASFLQHRVQHPWVPPQQRRTNLTPAMITLRVSSTGDSIVTAPTPIPVAATASTFIPLVRPPTPHPATISIAKRARSHSDSDADPYVVSAGSAATSPKRARPLSRLASTA